jgi:cardiolipin synthase
MNKQLYTLPNLVSLSRLLIGLPLCAAILNDAYLTIIYLTIYVVISDYADGFLSRRLGQISEIGKAIDPTVDFALMLMVLGVLLYKSVVPAWYMSIITIRYLLIGLVLYRYHKINHEIPSSLYSGKITICLTFLSILSFYFNYDYPTLHILIVVISLQMMLASLADYYHTYSNV